MESTLTFILGALVASTKGLALVAIGFGIAWWRTRSRLRRLEGGQSPVPADLEQRLDRLESSLEFMGATLDRLAAGQEQFRRGLASPAPGRPLLTAHDRDPVPGRVITPA
jgi:hypothetical protein